MGLIADMVPVNLESERARFFASGGTINPQFIYQREFDERRLYKYGRPGIRERERARRYLVAQPRVLRVEVAPEQRLTWEQVLTQVQTLCRELKLETAIGVEPVTALSSRFSVAPRGVLQVRWPQVVSREGLRAVLDHEIQTHYLRARNDRLQPWHDHMNRRARVWKRTEEGLATYNAKRGSESDLHSLAHLYLMVCLAQESDFVTVYRENLQYFGEEREAFGQTVRVKRGLTDTSRPGGFTKDIVYWEGYWLVREWLTVPGHNLRDLYWGKIGVEEVEQLRPVAKKDGLLYPTFIDERWR